MKESMLNFFHTWNFLILALLFALPGLLIWSVRPDLRRVIARVIPFSLPFALTEFLFYPSYWEPAFLFDLGRRIGFGIEDFLFVAGLAAFTTTAYAACCNRAYVPQGSSTVRACCLRALWLFGVSGVLLLGTLAAGISVIYGACLVMVAAAMAIIVQRRDLFAPALIGGGIAAAIYFVLCLVAGLLMPGIFETVWHAEKFLNRYLVGVPVEELLYGFAAGLAATAFYPYVFGRRFVWRGREGTACRH
jgi:hypothetical protein